MDKIITKLPDCIDPNKIIEKKINEEYGKCCPYCGESRKFKFDREKGKYIGIDVTNKTNWYGKQYEYSPGKLSANWLFFTPPKYWFEKKRHWEIKEFKCHNCRTEWSTPAYPKDIINSSKDLKLINQIFYSVKFSNIDETKLLNNIDNKLNL